jgi:hypothetical protein
MSYYPTPPVQKTAAPTTSDDSTRGYSVGMMWVDTVGKKAYVLVSAAVGAAVWTAVGAAMSFTSAGPYDSVSVLSSSAWARAAGTLV